MTPFEAAYGQKPPSVLSYLLGTSKVQAVDLTLKSRADILRTLKENMVMAQNRMKQQADQGRFVLEILKQLRGGGESVVYELKQFYTF